MVWSFPAARAHQLSESTVVFTFGTNGFEGQWDIAFSDIDAVLGGLDDDKDGTLSSEELDRHRQPISDYLLTRLQVRCDGVVRKLRIKEVLLTEHSGEPYFGFPMELEPPGIPETLEVEYSLFFDRNPQHRGMFLLNFEGKQQTALSRPRIGFNSSAWQNRRQRGSSLPHSPAKASGISGMASTIYSFCWRCSCRL